MTTTQELDFYGKPITSTPDFEFDDDRVNSYPQLDNYGKPIQDSDSSEISDNSVPELDYNGKPIDDSDSYEYSDNSDDDSVYIPMSWTPDQKEWDTESGNWE